MEKVTVCCNQALRGYRRWLSFEAHRGPRATEHYYEYVIPGDMLAIALIRGAWVKGGEGEQG